MALINKTAKGLTLTIMLSLALFSFTCSTTSAELFVPNLQLDIKGGTYDAATQTIVAPANQFTLYAYMWGLNPNSADYAFYISAALAPMTSDPNQGTFVFNSPNFNTSYNGAGINNTVNFVTDIYKDYGTPPHYDPKGQNYDDGDLESHGVFQTIFKEFKVVFDEARTVSRYDTKVRATAASEPLLGEGSMYYATFEVDTSGLAPGNAIHFDLYTVVANGMRDLDIGEFAPFDRDAQSLTTPLAPVLELTASATSVPDASIMLLLGPGLVGLSLLGRRKFKK